MQERDGNNVPLVTYTRGKDLSGSVDGAGGIGGLLGRTDHAGSSTAYYHCDCSGNVTVLVDASQLIVARYLYDPYGSLLAASGPLADKNLYRFSSKEAHVNSGLIYFGRRYYSPNLQRWMNKDPIGEKGGVNLYAYAANVGHAIDPWGLSTGVDFPLRPLNGSQMMSPTIVTGYYPYGTIVIQGRANVELFLKELERTVKEREAGGGIPDNNPVLITVDYYMNRVEMFAFAGRDPDEFPPAVQMAGVTLGFFGALLSYGVDVADALCMDIFGMDSFEVSVALGPLFAECHIIASELRAATSAAKTTTGAADDAAKWIWGQNKGVAKSIRQMDQRGWNPQQVTEAIKGGQQFPAQNLVNQGNPAIRYVHPQTGQSVVQDTVTKEIIHFGGPGFKY